MRAPDPTREHFTLRILPSCPAFRQKPKIFDRRLGLPYDDQLDDPTYFLFEAVVSLLPPESPKPKRRKKRGKR